MNPSYYKWAGFEFCISEQGQLYQTMQPGEVKKFKLLVWFAGLDDPIIDKEDFDSKQEAYDFVKDLLTQMRDTFNNTIATAPWPHLT